MTPFAKDLVEHLRQAPNHQLSAIVEMAGLGVPDRQPLLDRYRESARPLLYQECFSNLREVGPWLFSPGMPVNIQSQYDFHCSLTDMAGDAICGWLISALEPSRLADHLGQATTAQGPDGATYMLRFHTEQAFPVLHARHDLPGITHLLAPIRSWWVMEPHPEHKAWRHYTGYDQPQYCGVPLIHLDQACWNALAGDPLSYRLADQLHEPLAAVLTENCHGTRLGRVRKLLAQAREHGLKRPGDQGDYVTLLTLHEQELQASAAWQEALAEARAEGRPLALALKARIFPNLE
ncbi:TPA: DUF4123 domain-containing protein [Pseudomonas aeruginosa]|uniref:DUF4123 domain-containing protein n=1 Tax=Pseudomonas aeruginosa TaxID=287 RepID=UPI000FC42A99|nr:DUF4123 domain-containing protein [Pseudomonas aeruginosa]RUE29502.1 DUF4123 domain-containing protein [Pseudomonas aeruginosa]HBO0987440.1 DUF4123 domain-containing protein [Pseudomonas aeruginosa]HEJ3532264.1 DUF4123 domain-containing protein [Pseudomonas aeruginosa]